MEGGASKVKSLTQIHFHKVFTQISIARAPIKKFPLSLDARAVFAEEIWRIKICMSFLTSLSLAAFILRVLFYVGGRSQYTRLLPLT
jgi:hypothetical protein